MELESLGIYQLRSIKDYQFRPKPLTLIVGQNSSGKSTLLRTFPLFRQSMETVTRGPILWFGRFVDFGLFSDAVMSGAQTNDISFSFKLKVQPLFTFSDYYTEMITDDDTMMEVTLVVSAQAQSSNTYTKQVRLTAWGRTVEINAGADLHVESIKLDGAPLSISTFDLSFRGGTSLISLLVSRTGVPKPNVYVTRDTRGVFQHLLFEHIKTLFHGHTQRGTRAAFIRGLVLGEPSTIIQSAQAAAGVTHTSKTRISQHITKPGWIDRLQGLLFADRTPAILTEVDRFLSALFTGVTYVGPLRVSAERFYRQQDLAIDELDPRGENLAMFLVGLGDQRSEFSQWCEENIGISVDATATEAHVSIRIKEAHSTRQFNIADMGFGYSQILPILATVWRAKTSSPIQLPTRQGTPTRRRRSFDGDPPPRIVAMEQPELHLHPRLQGRLADLLCSIASNAAESQSKLQIICETHSETLINRVGRLVAEKKIAPEHVQVLVFEREEDTLASQISSAEYDENGRLLNWPFGFFLAD